MLGARLLTHTARVLVVTAVTSTLVLSAWAFVPLTVGWQPLVISSGSMAPWIQRGDIVVTDSGVHASVPSGAVVTFRRGGQLITHRVVGRTLDGGYVTKGDANKQRDTEPVSPDQIVARVRLVVPLLGMVPLTVREYPALLALPLLALLLLRRTPSKPAGNTPRKALAMALSLVLIGPSGAAFAGTTTNTGNSFAAADGYYSTVLASGPTSYWRLGETSGTTATDTMSVSNGTYSNHTFNQSSPLTHDGNPAVGCFTSTSCVSVPDNAAYHVTGAQSVAAWFKPSVASQGGNARVVAKYDGTILSNFLAHNGATAKMRFVIDVNVRTTATSTTDINNTSQWYYIVGTWDGSNARIYINGTLEQTVAGTGNVKQNNSPIVIASTVSGGPGARGTVDDVAVWSRALTGPEISTLYTRALA